MLNNIFPSDLYHRRLGRLANGKVCRFAARISTASIKVLRSVFHVAAEGEKSESLKNMFDFAVLSLSPLGESENFPIPTFTINKNGKMSFAKASGLGHHAMC